MLPVYKWKIQRKNEEGGKIGKFLKSSVFKELFLKKKNERKKNTQYGLPMTQGLQNIGWFSYST